MKKKKGLNMVREEKRREIEEKRIEVYFGHFATV